MASSPAEDITGKKPEASEASSGKWWDQYYVRYFVGTVVGVAIIFSLRDHAYLACDFRAIIPDFHSITAGQLTAVATAGLAYCYLASAPVLALHAVRGDWFYRQPTSPAPAQAPAASTAQPGQPAGLATTAAPTSIELAQSSLFENKALWLFGTVVLVVALVFGAIALGCVSPKFNSNRVGLGILGMVTLAQGCLLGHAFKNRLNRVGQFYSGLATQRTRERQLKRDYIDSYRHLREHGNAFAIVIFEILLGVVLANVETEAQFIASLVLWMLPASLSWLIGTWLEARLAFRDLT